MAYCYIRNPWGMLSRQSRRGHTAPKRSVFCRHYRLSRNFQGVEKGIDDDWRKTFSFAMFRSMQRQASALTLGCFVSGRARFEYVGTAETTVQAQNCLPLSFPSLPWSFVSGLRFYASVGRQRRVPVDQPALASSCLAVPVFGSRDIEIIHRPLSLLFLISPVLLMWFTCILGL